MAVNSFNAQNPPVTTKGDVFTFSTIPTRLGVGANNTVLTADSTTATGLKWATPSAGSMTLLSTTAMSGSATVTLNSISTAYNKLYIIVRDFYPSGTTAQFSVYCNGYNASNSYYGYTMGSRDGFSANNPMTNNSGWNITNNWSSYMKNADNDSILIMEFPDYTQTSTRKLVNWIVTGRNDGDNNVTQMGVGRFDYTQAISSISFNTNNGTWSGGTILLYGVN